MYFNVLKSVKLASAYHNIINLNTHMKLLNNRPIVFIFHTVHFKYQCNKWFQCCSCICDINGEVFINDL